MQTSASKATPGRGGTQKAPASAALAGPRKSTAAAAPNTGSRAASSSTPKAASKATSAGTTPQKPEPKPKPTGVGVEPIADGGVTAALAQQDEARNGAKEEPRALVLFDIDNTLYSAKLGIAQLMSVRIQAFFHAKLGLPAEEAQALHQKYYKQYGLAVRGLVRNHDIDPLEYDRLCDQSLPLDSVLEPSDALKHLLSRFDRTKCRVIALTNAYKVHAHRVLNCLEIAEFFEEVIFCDYSNPMFACKPEKEYFDAALAALSELDVSEFKIPPPPHHRIGKTYFVDDSALNTRAARDVCKWYSVVHFKESLEDGAGYVPAGALALPTLTTNKSVEDPKADPTSLTASHGTDASAKVESGEAGALTQKAAKESEDSKKDTNTSSNGTAAPRPDVGAPPKPTALDISLLQQAASSSALSLRSSSTSMNNPGDAARSQLLQQLVRLSPSVRLELFKALLDSSPTSLTPHLRLPSNGEADPAATPTAKAEAEQEELDLFQAELDARRLADEEARERAERRRRLLLYGGLWGAMDNVPRKVIVKVLGMLRVEDITPSLTKVSKKWQALTYLPELWASHARELMQNDPGGPPVGDPMAMTLGLGSAPPASAQQKKPLGLGLTTTESERTLADVEGEDAEKAGAEEELAEAKDAKADDLTALLRGPDGELKSSEWELLVKKLVRREWNWAQGIAQKVQYMEGHTGFVTSMKLKGRKTLVTGSYDETIRVWDTLSGHNRGIRNVALSEDVLVSVGQDKAIVVWDWRTGTKLLKFGQQSNVSLGTSIVDKDKIVAVTVDGIIRTFCIRRKEMIGQFDLSKLGGVDKALSAQLAGIGGDGMLQWFAAHGNTMTLAAKNLVVHLEWTEHIVPVEENPVPLTRGSATKTGSGFSSSSSFRTSLGPSTPTATRTRKDSTQTPISSSRPASRASLSPVMMTSALRKRNDSTASSASTVVSTSTTSSSARAAGHGAAPRKTMPAGNGEASRHERNGSTPAGQGHRSALSTSSSFRATPGSERRQSLNIGTRNAGATSPGARPPPVSPSSSYRFPSSQTTSSLSPLSARNGNQSLDFPPSATSPLSPQPGAADKPVRTRIAPNLEVAPRIVSVLRTPDISTGCTDPAKRRVVCSTRFSSRSGADRRLYSSTYSIKTTNKAVSDLPNSTITSPQKPKEGLSSIEQTEAKDAEADSDVGAAPTTAPVSGSAEVSASDHSSSVRPIRGAWSAEREKLSQPSRNPMAMILDHESCVVGCQDGTVYRLSFVGDEFGDEPDEPEPEPEAEHLVAKSEEEEESAGHHTISDLTQLEQIWSELMLPEDAPHDHPGRWRPPTKLEASSAIEQLGFK
ncbi:hypothetical protein OC861_000845 [Tilletia horrida]|nr:hypothetical protein OC861_000845 [Tilletia horrida]